MAQALQLHEDCRKDPKGWSPLDLAKLLESFDFEYEDLQEAGGWGVRVWRHGEHRDLNVVLFPSDTVPPTVTLHVVGIIDTLRQRLGQDGI